MKAEYFKHSTPTFIVKEYDVIQSITDRSI